MLPAPHLIETLKVSRIQLERTDDEPLTGRNDGADGPQQQEKLHLGRVNFNGALRSDPAGILCTRHRPSSRLGESVIYDDDEAFSGCLAYQTDE